MASPSPKHRSFWLQEALAAEAAGDVAATPPLAGAHKADIAILGGGYVGLWTAIRIKQQEPGCDVALLEQDICGGGASGRNGGFVLSWWPKLASLTTLFGTEEAIRICRESEDAISEISHFCVEHGIGADFRRGGWLWTATSQAQHGAWESVVSICEQMGVPAFQRLSDAEVASRAGSSAHRSGVFEASAAIVQPAALARGLRRVALASGVRIFEQTRVRSFTRSQPVVIQTSHGLGRPGTLTAGKLVIAANAWAASIRELHTAIAVISSDIVATAPAPSRLREIGWDSDLSITDSQTMVDYYRLSRDGRVIFGKGGWTIAYSGNVGANFDRHPQRAREVEADLRRYYPALRDVPVTHDWSGPIDRTPNSLPRLGHLDGREHIVYGIGWSGNGVGPSVIGGRVLAALALGKQDAWSRHPLVCQPVGQREMRYGARRVKLFPPEPVRFVGAHLVRTAVARKEHAELDGRKPAWLAVLLAKLAPAGLEDKQ